MLAIRIPSFFQNFANFRKDKNIIWDLTDSGGDKACGFLDLTKLGVNQFKKIFKKSRHSNMGELLKLVALISQLIDEEKNEALFNPVSIEDLLLIINLFKKSKSLGPNGWITEFFIDFLMWQVLTFCKSLRIFSCLVRCWVDLMLHF
jgi:hypothetical protein